MLGARIKNVADVSEDYFSASDRVYSPKPNPGLLNAGLIATYVGAYNHIVDKRRNVHR